MIMIKLMMSHELIEGLVGPYISGSSSSFYLLDDRRVFIFDNYSIDRVPLYTISFMAYPRFFNYYVQHSIGNIYVGSLLFILFNN